MSKDELLTITIAKVTVGETHAPSTKPRLKVQKVPQLARFTESVILMNWSSALDTFEHI